MIGNQPKNMLISVFCSAECFYWVKTTVLATFSLQAQTKQAEAVQKWIKQGAELDASIVADRSLPAHLPQPFWGDTEVFASQLRDANFAACPGCTLQKAP